MCSFGVILLSAPSLTTCNIGCKTLFSERGKLPLKLTCPASTSTCPATLLNKGKIGFCPKHCLPSGQVRVLFSLPQCRFLLNSLATCNGASSYVAPSLRLLTVRSLRDLLLFPIVCGGILVLLDILKFLVVVLELWCLTRHLQGQRSGVVRSSASP